MHSGWHFADTRLCTASSTKGAAHCSLKELHWEILTDKLLSALGAICLKNAFLSSQTVADDRLCKELSTKGVRLSSHCTKNEVFH